MSWIDGETGLPVEASEKIKKKLISITQINQELSNRLVILEEEKRRLMSSIENLQNKVDELLLENIKLKEQLERLTSTDNAS
ncbi:MAG: hypothetical protein QXI52_01775 [Nitrososphaerota archaeon]